MSKSDYPSLNILMTAEALSLPTATKRSGRTWTRCPHFERHSNNDIHPSLELRLSDNRAFCNPCGFSGDGFGLIRFALGCDFASALRWAREHNLINRSTIGKPPRNESPKTIAATYDYADADGRLLFQVIRFEPKSFAQRRPDGHGGWVWKISNVQRPLYRLPELLTADKSGWVFVPDGEKDVDGLRALGLVATCNPGGAGKWGRLADDSALHGRRVAIIADADAAGRKHAEDVARRLYGKATEVRVFEMPEGRKDAADWIKLRDSLGSDGLSRALVEMAESAPVWTQETAENAAPTCTSEGINNRVPLEALQKGGAVLDFALSLARVIAPRNVWFRRGFSVVTVRDGIVRRDDKPRPQIVVLTPTVARTDAEGLCRFYRETESGQQNSSVSVDTFKTVLDCTDFQNALPPLEAIVGAPTPYVMGDALAFTQAGYDSDAWCYTSHSFELDSMSPIDAADVLMEDLLGNFCFRSDADRANALSLLLTPTVRSLVRDLSPGFILKANRPGCGKTLLARLVGVVNDGIPPAICPQVTNDELRKQITSLLLGGVRIALFDNWKGRLDFKPA